MIWPSHGNFSHCLTSHNPRKWHLMACFHPVVVMYKWLCETGCHNLSNTHTCTQETFSHISPLIHLSTGSLSILKPLDHEEQDIFNLTIIAEDHGMPQHSSSQLLCVHVIDVNDEVPWFQESQYEAQISENQPPGTSVLTVSASDLDQGRTE